MAECPDNIKLCFYANVTGGGGVYRAGDRIVHPMHGAGVIVSIVSRKLNGAVREYYQMELPNGNMMVMIPTDHAEEIGVRPVVDSGEAVRIMELLGSLEADMSPNWNHRYRENMSRLKSGDLVEVARVVKGLYLRDRSRGLSTGERKMLHAAKDILVSELVLAQGLSYETVEKRINLLMK